MTTTEDHPFVRHLVDRGWAVSAAWTLAAPRGMAEEPYFLVFDTGAWIELYAPDGRRVKDVPVPAKDQFAATTADLEQLMRADRLLLVHKIVEIPDAIPGVPGIATVGLSEHGHREIACPVRPGEDVSSEFTCAVEVIGVFADMVAQGRQLDGEATMGYGPSGVRVTGSSADGPLLIEELAEPTKDAGGDWIPGVARLAALMDAGLEARAAVGLSGPPAFPSIRSMAMCCSRVDLSGRFSMERVTPLASKASGDVDSGWNFQCLEADHAHEADQIAVMPLVHMTAPRPAVVPFLGMPVGTSVVLERETIIVFAPGVDQGRQVRHLRGWYPPWWAAPH